MQCNAFSHVCAAHDGVCFVQVKVLCSSGGRFKKVEGGSEYTGGETRLVSVSNDCHMQELQDALHRVSQTMRLDLSSSSATVRGMTLLCDAMID